MSVTAIFVQPGQWSKIPPILRNAPFSAYRLIGRPECIDHGLPSQTARSLVTDHLGMALRTILIENQVTHHDIWIFHNPTLLNSPIHMPDLFRCSSISYLGVQDVETQQPFQANFNQTDLTILPWESLRFTDFNQLEWTPREDFLVTYLNHADRMGFSSYLAPATNALSIDITFADALLRRRVLQQEDRLFHKSKILGAIRSSHLQSSSSRPLSLLIDFSHVRNTYNGTMEYGRNLFQGILNQLPYFPIGPLKVLGNAQHLDFHGIPVQYLLEPGDDTVFDICFRPYQIDNVTHLRDLVFRCRRLVVSQLDVIGCRCSYIYDSQTRLIQSTALRICDGIIYISDYGRKDVENYFDLPENLIPSRAIFLGMEGGQAPIVSNIRPKAFMVIGSWRYDHKMLRPALHAIRQNAPTLEAEIVFHFLGDLSGEPDLPACVQYHKHDKTQQELEELFASVDGFIYPSVYEGFGLPITHAMRYHKPVLIADYEQNRDLEKVFGGSQFHYFQKTSGLPEAIKAFVDGPIKPNIPSHPRNWDDVARETLEFFTQCAQPPAQPESVHHRLGRDAFLLGAELCASYQQKPPQPKPATPKATEPPSQVKSSKNMANPVSTGSSPAPIGSCWVSKPTFTNFLTRLSDLGRNIRSGFRN